MTDTHDQGSIDQILARLDRLEAENEHLQQQLREATAAPRAASPTAEGHGPEAGSTAAGPIGRRRLLRTGLVAAGAAAGAAVLTDAQPAAASAGDAMVLGVQNFSLVDTSLKINTSQAFGFAVHDDTLDATPTGKPVIFANARRINFDNAIQGIAAGSGTALIATALASGNGVTATSASGYGVDAKSASGIAVRGTGGTNTGVHGVSASGFGVRGDSTSGIGVYGTSASDGQAAVEGVSLGYRGVQGVTNGGTAVHGLADTGFGVVGQAESGGGVVGSGGKFDVWLAVSDSRVAPMADAFAHNAGELIVDTTGNVWQCTVTGSNGATAKFRKVGGPATAGALHVLPAPVRVYDSRPGTAPNVAPKTPLVGNTARTIDLKANGTGVPAGATAALVTILLLNTAAGNGNFTLWANGVAKPSGNSMVWGGAAAGRYTGKELSALDANAQVQVLSSIKADVALDVVGYYR